VAEGFARGVKTRVDPAVAEALDLARELALQLGADTADSADLVEVRLLRALERVGVVAPDESPACGSARGGECRAEVAGAR
jgi:hypothetical protein